MKNSVKTMAKVTSSVLATSLAVMTPFSSVGVYAESATTIINQQDIYEAINTPDVETDKGIIFTNNYGVFTYKQRLGQNRRIFILL